MVRSGIVKTTWPACVLSGVGRTRRWERVAGAAIRSSAAAIELTVGFS